MVTLKAVLSTKKQAPESFISMSLARTPGEDMSVSGFVAVGLGAAQQHKAVSGS